MARGICLAELDRDEKRPVPSKMRSGWPSAASVPTTWPGGTCVARLRFCQGRWDEALAEVQAGLDLPDRLDMGRHLRGWPR